MLRKALVWWGLPLTRLEKDLRKELKNHGFWGHFGHGKGFGMGRFDLVLRPKVSKLKKSKINRLINMLQFYHHLKTIVLRSKCGQNSYNFETSKVSKGTNLIEFA